MPGKGSIHLSESAPNRPLGGRETNYAKHEICAGILTPSLKPEELIPSS